MTFNGLGLLDGYIRLSLKAAKQLHGVQQRLIVLSNTAPERLGICIIL